MKKIENNTLSLQKEESIHYEEFKKIKNKSFYIYKQKSDQERFYYIKKGKEVLAYKVIYNDNNFNDLPKVFLSDTMSLRSIQKENSTFAMMFFYDDRPIQGVYYNDNFLKD